MKKSENNKESSSCPEAILGCGSSSSSVASDTTAATTTTAASATGYANAAPPINLNITTTTGGNFSVLVDVQNSVENLKKIIAKRLKVAKDRICLLHRERELQDGNLRENGLVDGSKIILIPNVETGLLAQRPENTVMQALESLNDAQVNDFLSGKTPLNLSMRLGDHMMLIQLQLSTVSPSSPPNHNRSRPRSRNGRSSTSSSSSSTPSSSTPCTPQSSASTSFNHDSQNLQNNSNSIVNSKKAIDSLEQQQQQNMNQGVSTSPSSLQNYHRHHHQDSIPDGELDSFLNRHGFDSIDDIVKNFSFSDDERSSLSTSSKSSSSCETKTTNVLNNCCSSATVSSLNNSYNNVPTIMDQSPIKSLSNLVSNPLKSSSSTTTPIKSTPAATNFIENLNNVSHIERVSMCSDPISAKLTSCLCKRLDGANAINSCSSSNSSKECETNHCQFKQELSPPPPPLPPSTDCSASTAAGTESMITDPSENFGVNHSTTVTKPVSIHSPHTVSSSSLLHKTVNNPIAKSKHRLHSSLCNALKRNFSATFDKQKSNGSNHTASNNCNISKDPCGNGTMIVDEAITLATPTPSTITATDARALAEASRNLTQTLRKLSKEVFTNKIDLSDHHTSRKNNSGAVIESMKNHGKGIYSGTFSGTLNPALQDQFGRPKRDISTVIHILNDLLSATPQYNRDTKINFEPSSSSLMTSGTASSLCGRGPSNHKQFLKHNFSTPSEQECKKCIKSTNTTCAYGECNGHSSSSSILSTSNTAIPTAKTDSHNHRHYHHHLHHHNYSTSSASAAFTKFTNSNCQNSSSTSSFNVPIPTMNESNVSSADINLSATTSSSSSDERNLLCTCNKSYRNSTVGSGLNGDSNNSGGADTSTTPAVTMCNKCSIDLENSKTKCKLDQLRLVMQQRKQKREARKLKGTPYGALMLSSQQLNNSPNNTNGGGNSVIDGLNSNNDDGNNSNNIGGGDGMNTEQNANGNDGNTTNPATATSSATTANTITSIAPPSEVSPNHIVEEVDTAA